MPPANRIAVNAATGAINTEWEMYLRGVDDAVARLKAAVAAISTFGASLIDDADAAAARVTLGVGQLAALIEDRKSSGASGGSFTAGAWRTRDLNTLAYNRDSVATLASNRFTLPAGTWLIKWRCPALYVEYHQSQLYNYTASAAVEPGSNAFCDNGTESFSQTDSSGQAVVTIAAATAFEIQHQCTRTQAFNGFGAANSFGTEVYSQTEIWRL